MELEFQTYVHEDESRRDGNTKFTLWRFEIIKIKKMK